MSTHNPLGKLQQRSVRAAAETPPRPAPPVPPAQAGIPGEAIIRGKKRRGSQAIVRQTVRLRREDWQRMCELKARTGLSSQEQVMMGLGLLFAQYDLPPPTSPSES